MNSTCTPIHWPRILLASCVAILLACSSSSSNNNGSGGSGGAGGSGVGGGMGGGAGGGGALDLNGFGQKYKLADNEVAGWTQDASEYAFSLYDSSNLSDRIDGPATGYVNHGMKFALYQNLNGPDGVRICTLVAMAFDTAADAKSMVEYEQQLTSANLTIPPYDSSVAVAYSALTGITIYAHFNSLYLEVGLDGYGNPVDMTLASQDGAAFLQALAAKPKLQ